MLWSDLSGGSLEAGRGVEMQSAKVRCEDAKARPSGGRGSAWKQGSSLRWS